MLLPRSTTAVESELPFRSLLLHVLLPPRRFTRFTQPLQPQIRHMSPGRDTRLPPSRFCQPVFRFLCRRSGESKSTGKGRGDRQNQGCGYDATAIVMMSCELRALGHITKNPGFFDRILAHRRAVPSVCSLAS